jgi:hypothetical protein
MDNKGFEWTDYNVLEFVKYMYGYEGRANWQDDMASFKASKQPKPQLEILEYKGEEEIYYVNSIGEYVNKRGHGWRPGHIPMTYVIQKVRRGIDGEVFTVGDVINFEGQWRTIQTFQLTDGFMEVIMSGPIKGCFANIEKIV